MRLDRSLRTLGLIFAASCANVIEPDPLLPSLLGAPTELSLDGVVFEAEAFAWRDFQPGVGGDRSSLNVLVTVEADSPAATIDRVWAIRGSEVWGSEVTAVEGTSDWIARGGPRWEPETTIQVVIQVRDASLSKHLLRRPSVLIGAPQ